MSKIPIAHKAKLQAAYVRFRELAIETPVVLANLQKANLAKWAGFLILVFWFIRIALGRDWPDPVGGLAFAVAIGGWAYAGDQRKKLNSLFEEESQIHQISEASGAYFSKSSGRITVYVGEIANENIVNPLNDSAYE